MAELTPAPFADLVARLHREPAVQGTLFELPRRHWYRPGALGTEFGGDVHKTELGGPPGCAAGGPELGVDVLGQRAGNPVGPAAGPHTQMAQNILLSYVAGGRVLELKTVQVNDRLTISRPCIDVPNVGYNVEWSQELRIEESLREYVAGAMLVEMFRRGGFVEGASLAGPAGAVVYDASVGYDLAGIRSAKVGHFLEGVREAGAEIERLRGEIPAAYAAARDYEYPRRLCHSVTLSTFHGCPPGEIERIAEYLMGEHDFNVVVKMNPPTLGRARLEHLLYDVLGYTTLHVDAGTYVAALGLDEAVQLGERLMRFAEQRGRRFGLKFTNTLEVRNERGVFAASNRSEYLSGPPLYVIALTLADELRRRIGPALPVSFSAGIDRRNAMLAVACGFAPVTVVTDLLRAGGYGRLHAYLAELARDMGTCGAASVEQYVLRRFGQEAEARRRAVAECGAKATAAEVEAAAVRWAGLLNTAAVAELARNDPRYTAAQNGGSPKKVDSHLTTFDCLTCDRCLAACPNAALFEYPTEPAALEYHDVLVTADGAWRAGPARRFTIGRPRQVACYADFCNECGNCETYCPERGGPYRTKPLLLGSLAAWERAAPRDAFVLTSGGDGICGRVRGQVFRLAFDEARGQYAYDDGVVRVTLSAADNQVVGVELLRPVQGEHQVDMAVFHLLRVLWVGVRDPGRVNQVNAGIARGGR